MKHFLKQLPLCLVLSALSLLSFAAACSDKESNATPPDIQVAKSELNFSKTGGISDLAIKSNVELDVTSDQAWCTVTPVSSTSTTVYKYTIEVTASTETSDRTALITVSGGTATQTVTVKQTATEGLVVETTRFDDVKAEGISLEVKLKTNGDVKFTSNNDWITETPASRAMTDEAKLFAVAANYGQARTGTITLTLGALTETVTVNQLGSALSDAGMNSDAKTLAAKIKIGWNLGNALEVPASAGGETGWGNAKATKQLIDAVKAAGFNAVRLPCAWDGYIEDAATYKIKESWMTRVNEVVDYCVANDLYVIVNIHWDGGWLENNPTYAKQAEVNKKQRALWTQIAERFKNYDEHLLFAGTNEVHVEGVYDNSKITAENHEVQQSYNQTFVDAVRATGARNAQRNLIVQAYNTNIELGVKYLKIPQDAVKNRLMVEVHYYDPSDFTLSDVGNVKFWGEPYKNLGVSAWGGQEDHLEAQFQSCKTAFVDKGFPVILGEYGASRRSKLQGDELKNHLASRAYYLKTVTATARKYSIVPIYWDNGHNGDDTMALFNRANGSVFDQQALDALMQGLK